MNIFLSIEDGQVASIKAVKTPKGTINILIDASTMEEATALLKEADSEEVISQVQEDQDQEHIDNTDHYFVAPVTMEKAQRFIDNIEKSEERQCKVLFNSIEKGGNMAIRDNRQLGCLDAYDLVMQTYAGDPYQTIINSFNIGYYRGYTRCKRDMKKGD